MARVHSNHCSLPSLVRTGTHYRTRPDLAGRLAQIVHVSGDVWHASSADSASSELCSCFTTTISNVLEEEPVACPPARTITRAVCR